MLAQGQKLATPGFAGQAVRVQVVEGGPTGRAAHTLDIYIRALTLSGSQQRRRCSPRGHRAGARTRAGVRQPQLSGQLAYLRQAGSEHSLAIDGHASRSSTLPRPTCRGTVAKGLVPDLGVLCSCCWLCKLRAEPARLQKPAVDRAGVIPA